MSLYQKVEEQYGATLKPILMNTKMTRATLDEIKKLTRRVFSKAQEKYFDLAIEIGEIRTRELWDESDFKYIIDFSKYKTGDILYVRETFSEWLDYEDKSLQRVTYKASDEDCSGKWKPSIHMPKEYARIFLKVTNVRVERLRDMSMLDIRDEGCPDEYINGITGTKREAVDWWINLWNSTAPKGYKWEDNPYVFVYEFERLQLK